MDTDYSYLNVTLQDNMTEDVFAALIDAGVAPSDKYDLHVTVMFDERDIEKPLYHPDPTKKYAAKVVGMGKLGDAYVFHLNSPDLLEQFRLLKTAGYKHSYGTPMFHMSLGYKLDTYSHLELEQVFADWMGRELVFDKLAFGFKKDK